MQASTGTSAAAVTGRAAPAAPAWRPNGGTATGGGGVPCSRASPALARSPSSSVAASPSCCGRSSQVIMTNMTKRKRALTHACMKAASPVSLRSVPTIYHWIDGFIVDLVVGGVQSLHMMSGQHDAPRKQEC